MRRVAVAVLLALAACSPKRGKVPETIGLFTSLPLVWSESGDIRGQLADRTPGHWAMSVLKERGRVLPLDSLSGAKGLPLPRDGLLMLAQPRALTPQENVALDSWVRGGGRVLLFADPMLTAASVFPLGDPRRPQDIAMLSPILHHWGLELEFDENRPAGERRESVFDTAVPVDLAGRFRVTAPARCVASGGGLGIDCAIGAGRVIAIADAAVLDGEDAGRSAVIAALLDRLSRR